MSECFRNGGDVLRFGILTVSRPESLSAGRRAALRLRPGKGIRYGEGLFRTALFVTADVTLPAGWPDSLAEKRVAAALRYLAGQGVQQAVLPERWQPLAREYGLVPIRTGWALEACAARAVSEACSAAGQPLSGVVLAVCGRNLSRTACGEVLTLARSVRTVRVYGEGNESLRAQLWRSCGIVDRGPMPEDVPVLCLRFAGGQAGTDALLTIDLSGEAPPAEGNVWVPQPLPPAGALGRMPPEVCPGAFAAALLRCGAVQGREIRVSRLDIPGPTQYNKEIVENCL